MPRKLLFENRTCSRCGGSGEYSYCSMYGRVCFKCGGNGVVLTKRGRVAQNWLNARKRKPVGEVVIGDRVRISGVPGYIRDEIITVDTIDTREDGIKINGADARGGRHGLHTDAKSEVTVLLPKERIAELRIEAKAFEATLTKTGTVRKRRATITKEAA